jgi:hypothetical protein
MRVQALVIGLATFVVGLFAGLIISPGGDTDRPAGPTYTATDDPPSTPARTEQPQPAPEPEPPPAAPEQPPEPAEPREGQSPYEAWLASLEVEIPPAGTGRIWGTVTSLGQPVGGATVRARPLFPEEYPRTGTMEEQLEHRVRSSLFGERAVTEAVTGPDGRYEFTGLAEGDHMLEAEADGYRMVSRAYDRHTPDTEVNLVMRPVAYLVLDVRLPNGSQPERAQVSYSHGNSRSGGAWSPASPELEIPIDSISVTVQYDEFRAEEFTIAASRGERVRRTVQLASVGQILCRVEAPPGVQAPRRLSLHKEQNPGTEPPTAVSGFGSPVRVGSPEQFGPLVPGRYRVILAENQRVIAWEDVDVADRRVEVVFTLEAPEHKPEDFIPVRVLGPSGNPIGQPRFEVWWTQNGSRSQTTVRPVDRGDGLFWLPRHQPSARHIREGVEAVYIVQVTSAEHGQIVAKYPDSATHELLVRFDDATSLEVNVPGASGSPYRGDLRVYLIADAPQSSSRPDYIRPPGARNIAMLSEVTAFPRLQPGRYRVVLVTISKGDFGDSEYPLMEEWVDIRSGANRTTLQLPTLHSLTVVLPEGAGPMSRPTLEFPSGQREVLRINASRQRVGVFPAGSYILSDSGGRMRINLTSDLEVTLDFSANNALEVRNIGEEGEAYDMGFREGDLVIAVDGEDPEDAQRLRELVNESLRNETTTWTVIRNGARVNLRLNGPAVAVMRANNALGLWATVRE